MRRVAFMLLLWAGAAGAQKAKPVELYVGYSVGGGYDIYARLLARHMGRHLPGNPVVVPKNMEGAGSLRLANWLNKAAPRAMAAPLAPSAAPSPSSRSSASRRRSSRAPTSAGSAAPTTK